MDHEIPVRIVDNQEYMKVVRSILEEGKEVPLVVTGNSMMPFLIDYFIGDGQKNIEGPIKETRIFGVITGVLRKGKYLDEHTFTWRFFENIWRYVIPFRPLIIKIYSLFKR